MTCRELTELLLDYVEGALEAERSEAIRIHLEGCPPCVQFVASYQLTVRLTRQLPPAPVPAGLLQRCEQALQGRPPAGLPPA